MQLDGLKPTPGTTPAERLKGKPMADPGAGSAGAKSFGDAFAKARAAGPPAPSAPASPAPASEQAPPPAESHIDTIRFRLQSGYYNNPKVADAVSDKLSGYFDDVA
jgi:cell division protein FtsN